MIPIVVQLKSVDQQANTKQSSQLLLIQLIVKLKKKLKIIRQCTSDKDCFKYN